MQASASIQTPGGAAASFFSWTVIVLILLAVGAVIVVAGMIYGNRLARDRHRAQEAAEERADEAGIEPTPASAPLEESPLPELAKEPDPADRAAEQPAEPTRAPAGAAAVAARPEPQPAPPQPEAATETPHPPRAAEPVASETPAPAVELAIAGALALTTIKGLGPKVAAMLAERGVTRVDQIAALDDADAAALNAQLGTFAGRMTRDRWIDQARLLASGDTAAYEAEFGKLG